MSTRSSLSLSQVKCRLLYQLEMASALRVVPWVCVDEWKQMYYWLYSKDMRNQRQGLDRVVSWRSRCKLPVAVECTAALIECHLQHACSGADARSAYALAIVRFVNGITDIHQTTTFAKSVSGLASWMGLPQWLVDLRHDSTHKTLPSIELLKKGCEEALIWLRVNYWETHLNMLQQDQTEERRLRDKVACIVGDYVQCQLQLKDSGVTKRNRANREEIMCRLVNTVSRITEGDRFLIELLSTNYIMKKYSNCKDASEYEDGSFQLPASTVDIWQPLLQHLHTHLFGFVPHLLANFIKTLSLSQIDSQSMYTLCCWILLLIRWCSEPDHADRSLNTPVTVHWPSVVRLCLEYPGIYSRKILDLVEQCIGKGKAREEFGEWIEKTKTLVDIYCGSTVNGMVETMEDRELNVEDIENQQEDGTDRNEERAVSCTWMRCEDSFAWGMCPLGLAPHQEMTGSMFGLMIGDEKEDTSCADTDTENDIQELECDTIETDACRKTNDIVVEHGEWTDTDLRKLQQHIELL